ncbi:MAG TPA: thiopeptide-type bacteriocin biosynthesis protein [Thermoanaerobaculia bacterium]|nr:thiopeptide-type bacteriocin biosynthesis protein [Thermoanaerobaculia bacterium]
MDAPLCLFTLLYAPREEHDRILADFATPVARDLRNAPELHSLFFARYNVPRWQVRFRVLGQPDWVAGPVRDRVERALEPLQAAGAVEGIEFAQYDRELERYGGEEGMALAEKLFLHDSLACLDLLAAERQGQLLKSRREVSLLMTEQLLDLLGLDRAQRLAFYAHGYRWTREMGTWSEADLATIEQKYQSLKTGLQDLFTGEPSRDPLLLWGGEAPARIAERWREGSRPVARAIREAHDAGRLGQGLIELAWSYAHMSCNRLGIDPTPEALLRYFLHRLYEDGGGPPAGS